MASVLHPGREAQARDDDSSEPSRVAERAQGTATDAAASKPVSVLARLGFAAHGAVYLLLGVFALLLAFGHSSPEADQHGAMQEAARHTGGFIVLIILAIGFAGYALWRFIEAVFGTAQHGKDVWPRVLSLGRGVIYAGLAYSALSILITRRQTSQSHQQQMWSARLMSHTGGRWLIAIAGMVLAGVGIGLAIGGARRTFKRYFEFHGMPSWVRRTVMGMGTVGVTARGAVFAVIGVFLILAAWHYDPGSAAGLDGALRRLESTNGGVLWVGAVGAGLLAFGLYGFAEAIWRSTDTAADREAERSSA